MLVRVASALLIAVSVVAGPMSFLARPAHACSCVRADVDQWVARADLIVTGTVLEITQDSDSGHDLTFDVSGHDLTFDVDEYLKGTGPETLVVHDNPGGSDACSPFEFAPVGQSYLLFLRTGSGDRLSTSTCEGSRIITDETAEQDIEEIRRIVAGEPEATVTADTPGPTVTVGPDPTALPSAGGGGTTSSGASPWAVAGASAAGIVALAGFLFITWRGVRRRDAG